MTAFGQVLGPVGALLFHLAPGVAAFFQGAQGFLQGLGHLALVDHPAAQVDDLVDVLDAEGALLLAGAAGGAGPDLVLVVDAADQGSALFERAAVRVDG